MSLRLEIRKKMVERSPRVKAIDFHNTNTWVVFGLYSGTIALHDYSNNVSRHIFSRVFEQLKLQIIRLELLSLCVKNIG